MPYYKLHCFAKSGNAYKAALMLELTGQDWQPVNEQGEVPVLEHAGKSFTQSALILDYLAELSTPRAAS